MPHGANGGADGVARSGPDREAPAGEHANPSGAAGPRQDVGGVPERFVLRAGEGADAAVAEVAALGAELRRWTVGGRDMVWSGDPQVWDGVAPVLFPVVGWTRGGRVRISGETYPLGLHGFARHCTFEVSATTESSVSLTLRETEQTLALYPFPFRLTVTYTLAAGGLDVVLAVANTGPGPMPYAAGWHPGFLGPPGQPCDIVFDQEERRSVPVIAPGGLFSAQARPVDFDGRTLPLRQETFAGEALCFLHARSRGLSFGSAAQGAPRLRVVFESLPHIVLWSRPGAPFVCIEGWSGWGDPEGYEGEFSDKPGMIHLPPGAERRHAMRTTILPGHEQAP